MSDIQISQKDLEFASLSENCQENGTMDAIDRLRQHSEPFYWLIMNQADECSRSADEFSSPEYCRELERFSKTLNYFLLFVWSANEGRLPFIHPSDYQEQVQTMGRTNYQMTQLFQQLSQLEEDGQKNTSFHLMLNLKDKLDEMSVYTKGHLLLMMRVILKAVIWEHYPPLG